MALQAIVPSTHIAILIILLPKILQLGPMEAMTHVPTLRKRLHTKEYVVSQAKLKL